ncbi:hypothetical protein A2814_02400 [Candidatus Nomurabacteria bacterium RIFCSPHIGHO2_01_FULL_38_19]|uniref:Uncharacterized protein n=1 Tax=Candidatus Nomurabacteria bacterium RIFCSPHIGHO2_01_FULL_38_19 TaxID=1801732 RepID=A0A1F6UR28_9BACT|nr:MAG: hypothetical protein A2814_02400 [Candidatus Nomurabacteria bacterium RIFCSPHIGHO2_01_FULL_38_19]
MPSERQTTEDQKGLEYEKKHHGSGQLKSQLDPAEIKKREISSSHGGRIKPKPNLEWYDRHQK